MVELPPPPSEDINSYWQVPDNSWIDNVANINTATEPQQGADMCSSSVWDCQVSPDGTMLFMDNLTDATGSYQYPIDGDFVIVNGNRLVMVDFINIINGSSNSDSTPTETPIVPAFPTAIPENIPSATNPIVSTNLNGYSDPNSERLISEETSAAIDNFIINLPAPVQRGGAWISLIVMGVGAFLGIRKVFREVKDVFTPEPVKGPYGVINPRDGKWYSKEDWQRMKEAGSKGSRDNEPDADTITWLNDMRTRQDFIDKQEAYKKELEKFNHEHGTEHSLDELGFDRVDDLLREARTSAIEEEFKKAYAARDERMKWLQGIGFGAMDRIKEILNGDGNVDDKIEKQKDTMPNGGLWDKVPGIKDPPDDNPKN